MLGLINNKCIRHQSHCLHSLLDSNSLTTDTHSLGSDSVTPATLSPTPVRLCDSACSTTLVTTLGHILSSSQTFSSSETRPANHRSRHCTLCTLCTILLLYDRYQDTVHPVHSPDNNTQAHYHCSSASLWSGFKGSRRVFKYWCIQPTAVWSGHCLQITCFPSSSWNFISCIISAGGIICFRHKVISSVSQL